MPSLKAASPNPLISIISVLFLASLSLLAGGPAEAVSDKAQTRGHFTHNALAALLQECQPANRSHRYEPRVQPGPGASGLRNDALTPQLMTHRVLEATPALPIYRF